MQEPVYEYNFPEPYINPPKYFPLRKQFNTYMDMHRDPKQIAKETLVKRLEKINPLEGEPPLLPYPAAVPTPQPTSWERKEAKKERLGVGKYRDLFRGRHRPHHVLDEFKPVKYDRPVNKKFLK
ncbi:39S ribosomal protein L38, mitochondrial [Halocaridina rubra]|uniref:39S ribosomal protein L38, mitochondrial n=1 Tax=Halocaridina rubra TaxID=373956 RepID=A0AAN8XAY5_HALRR